MHSELIYWMWVTLAFGPGNPRKWNTLAHYDSAESAYNKISSGDLKYVQPEDKRNVKNASLDQARKIIDLCEENDIQAICFDDERFPDRLREIYNPPSMLFVKGDLGDVDNTLIISCVGTKSPSEYSVSVAKKICSDLAKAGVTIASGFTVGLDSIAHTSAMKVNGRTIAVLPCGLLYDYPKENSKSKPLIAEHGALISECFPNEKASTISFRSRNRILSGIGLGTLILQAGVKSGSLSTASFALSQGRDIFCIPPHDIFDENYVGVVNLIRDGAIPVFDARDVLNEYFSTFSHRLNLGADIFSQRSNFGFLREIEKERKPKTKRSKKKEEVLPEIPTSKIPSGLSGDSLKVYEHLSLNGAVLIDDISYATGVDIDDLEQILTDLELDGHVRSLPGNRFSI